MKKILKKIILIIVILIAVLAGYLFIGKAKPAKEIEWGVSFSKRTAIDYGLDWQKSFSAILDDLKVKKIRLVAYWDEIEPEEGKYNFNDLEWQLLEVERHEGQAIFAIGRRMPRWPECFEPEWVKGLSEQEKQEKILDFLKATINYFKDRPGIKIWQIENEPFLGTFGKCPKLDKKFLDKEVVLVKYLDPWHPIMITESGEFSTWIGGAKRADIVGTSIYRKIYGKLGYVQYPIPPVFYHRKAILIKSLFNLKDIIAIEVQAEPWGPKPVKNMTSAEQDVSMSLKRFNDVIKYTQETGFDKAYLWGVEWWYWRKTNGDDSFWETAKKLFVN